MASVGRNAVYNLLGTALPLLLSLVTIPAYLHLVGTERYGVLAIAWLLLGYFGLFDLGIGKATAYRIAAQRDAPSESRAETFWTAALVNPALGVVGGILLYLGAHFYFSRAFEISEILRPEILTSIPFLAMAVPVMTLSAMLTGTLQGREKFAQVNFVSATTTVLFQLMPLTIAWAHGPYLPLLLAAAIGARLIGCSWLGWLAWREIARGHPLRFSGKRFRDLLNYGSWAAASSLVGPLLLITDRFIIGAAFGANAVTLYSVPLQLIQRVMIVPTAVTSALMPRMSAATAHERNRLGQNGGDTIEALLTPTLVVAIVLAKPLLSLWVGAHLGIQMAPLARIMLVGYWLFALSAMQITCNYSDGHPERVTRAYLIELPLYAFTLAVAIQWFGLLGATVAAAMRSGLDLLIQGWSFNRALPRARTGAAFLLLIATVVLASAPLNFVTQMAGSGVLIAISIFMAWRTMPAQAFSNVASAIIRRASK